MNQLWFGDPLLMKPVRYSRGKLDAARGLRDGRSAGQPRLRLACETLEDRRLLTVTVGPQLFQPLVHDTISLIGDATASPALSGTSSPNGFSPTQIRHAYGFDQSTFDNGTITGDGSGETIAIIEAYHDPQLAAEVAAFDSAFNIPAPEPGAGGAGWNDELSDHRPSRQRDQQFRAGRSTRRRVGPRSCAGASILVVEANDATFGNLITNSNFTAGAVIYARSQPGVAVVSMSFGAGEFQGEDGYDTAFTTPSQHTPVSFVSSTGDTGAPGEYPAYSPNVLAVGGTTVSINPATNQIASETGWHESGGGISTIEPQPSFQSSSGLVTQSSTARTTPDVSFDAGAGSAGVRLVQPGHFDAVDLGRGHQLWRTSWAAMIAIADQGRRLVNQAALDSPTLLSKVYTLPSQAFNDITQNDPMTNGNGAGSTGPGYDLVTGRGSPVGSQFISGVSGTSSISGTVFFDANQDGASTTASRDRLGGASIKTSTATAATTRPVTNNHAGPSASIPRLSSGTSSLTVPSSTTDIVNVNVTANISFNGDSSLTLTLISPSGAQFTLAAAAGGGGSGYNNTVFDDSGQIAIAAGTAPFSPSVSYQPTTALTSLIGTNPAGTWKLKVTNSSFFTSGTINSWTLTLTTGDPSTVTSSNGTYQFTNLPAATYKLGEVLQAPYVETSPSGGINTVSLPASRRGHWAELRQLLGHERDTDWHHAAADERYRRLQLRRRDEAQQLQPRQRAAIPGQRHGVRHTVTLRADGNTIGSAVASGSTTTITTNGASTLSDGNHVFTAVQTEVNKAVSSSSPSLTVKVDTTAPSATITPVNPNPSTSSVSQMTIVFSEPVSGLNLSDLQFTRNGGANLLSGAKSSARATASPGR